MEVPLGFRKARLELQKRTRNYRVVREGFIAGGTHPDDIPGVIKLYERFAQVCYMQQLDSRERAHYDDRYPKFALEIVKRCRHGADAATGDARVQVRSGAA